MEVILSAIIGYFLGSLPTAYLLVKKYHNVNITNEGSGNNGAMNTYEVSGSKLLGGAVFIIDFIKGAAAVYISKLLFGNEFLSAGTAMVFAVAGHCYSVWLKFKGGRGIATAGGALVLLTPVIALLWVILWIISYLFRKNIHFANAASSVLVAALAGSSAHILNNWSIPPANSELVFAIITGLVMLLIIIKHIEPMKAWFVQSKQNVRDKNEQV